MKSKSKLQCCAQCA